MYAVEDDPMSAPEAAEPVMKESRRRLLIGAGVAGILVMGAVIAGIVVLATAPKRKNNASSSASNSDVAGNGGDGLVASTPTTTPTLFPTIQQPTALPSANEPPTISPTFRASMFPSFDSSPISTTLAPNSIAPNTIAPNSIAPGTTTIATASPSAALPSTSTSSSGGAEIQSGQASSVDYLYCQNGNAGSNEQIVLWHGSSFSKETWLDKGILQDFCDSPFSTVIAMDLSVGSDYQRLIQVLDAMRSDGVLDAQLPVTLVTPSASGYGVVSWIMSSDVDTLPSYVSTWVPVATGSLVSASDDEVSYLGTLTGLRILAINGDGDSAGGKYSARLEALAGATAVELPGGHAVYLQSPVEFADTIVNFVTG